MNASGEDVALAWFAVLTKARSEQQAVDQLKRQGFDCFLPRVRHQRRSARGMRDSVEALFPRYVFIRARADGWTLGPVRSTRGVSGVVRFGNQPAHVPEGVVAQIRSRMDADQCVTLDVPQLRAGEPVQITDGPLAGMRAVFDVACGNDRVRLLMEILGERVAVVVPRMQLATGFVGDWSRAHIDMQAGSRV